MSREINVKITATAANFSSTMQKVSGDIQKGVASAKTLGPAVQGATTSLGQMQGAAVSGGKAINQFGNDTELAQGKLGKFGKIFSDNRGIVFGIAGLTSALGEAVGMMGMYGDTAQRVKEAQEELNNLEEQGVTSGKAHADAVAEVVKQQRFFNMVSRNTILSQMDMIFFTTMVISGLVKMNSEGGAAAGMLAKLKGFFTGAGKAIETGAGNIANFMANMSPMPNVMTTTSTGVQKVTSSMGAMGGIMSTTVGRVLALSGALAGIGVAAVGIFALIQSAEEMKAKFSEVFGELALKTSLAEAGVIQMKMTIGTATEDEKKRFGEVTKAIELQDKVMRDMGVSVFAFQTNWGGAADKVLAKMQELIDKSPELRESLGIPEPMSDLEAFNSGLEEMRDIQTSINPHIQKFQQYWNQTKPPMEDGNKLIKSFVTGLALAPPLAEELESDLQAWLEHLAKSDKELNKVLTSAEKMKALSGTEEGKGIMSDFLGSPEVAAGSWAERIGMMEGAVTQITGIARQKFEEFNTYVESGGTLTAEQWINTWSGTTPEIKNVFMGMVEEAVNAVDGFKVIMENLQEETSKNTAAFLALRNETSKWFDVTGMSISQMEAANAMFKNTFGSIIAQSQAIKDNEMAWNALKDSGIQFIDQKLNEVAAWAKTNDMLATSLEWQFKVKNAQVQGLVEAKKWTEQMLLSAESAETYRANLINLNSGFLKNVDTSGMLTSEIQTLITAMKGGSDAAIQLARDQNDAAISSLNFFDSLTSAKSKKDFKKAWKEMDWGSIPKRFKDDFKDMFKELGPIREKANEVATAIRGVNVALQFKQGSVGKTAISGTLKEITKDLGDIAKVDVGAAKIKEKILDPINELNSKQAKSDALKKIPQTLEGIANALDDGSISLAEYNELMMQNAIETGNFNNLTPQQIQYLESIGISTGKAADATALFTEEMAKVQINAIVVQTIGQMWAELGQFIMEANNILLENWSVTMVTTAKIFATMILNMIEQWGLFTEFFGSKSVEMANKWETAMKNVAHNSKAASSQTQSEFSSLVKKLNSHFVKIANNFEKAMRNIAQNAKAAASQANSALASIKDRTVTITYKEVGKPKAQGDAFSFSNGGVISAARGLMTSNGPTRAGPYLFGDNSGGREIMAFIPKDGHKAEKILDMINAQLGRKEGGSVVIAGGGGDKIITVPIVINIGGEQYSFVRKYRLKQGQEVASQVGG